MNCTPDNFKKIVKANSVTGFIKEDVCNMLTEAKQSFAAGCPLISDADYDTVADLYESVYEKLPYTS